MFENEVVQQIARVVATTLALPHWQKTVIVVCLVFPALISSNWKTSECSTAKEPAVK